MRRTTYFLLVTVVAGVAGGLFAAASSSAVADVTANQFTVREKLVAVHRTDVGAKGRSVGDTDVFMSNSANTERPWDAKMAHAS